MPKGPQGQWRPAGAGALAAHVCRIATGEIEETYDQPQADSGNAIASRRASNAGKARSAKLTPERRTEIARAAASARWSQ